MTAPTSVGHAHRDRRTPTLWTQLYGPIEVELDWLHLDPLVDAVQPRRARLTADRIYDGLDWAAVAEVALGENLHPVRIVTTLVNPLHRQGPSDGARRSWRSEALRFASDHVTPDLILSLARAGAIDWLSLTSRRISALGRRLAEAQEAHRGAVLAHAVAQEDDQAVRVAAARLLDAWEGSDEALLAEAGREVSASPEE